jgi:hypothetical protein
MMDAMTYEMAQRKNIGWMSEAHRLSLGANRPRKRPNVSSNSQGGAGFAFSYGLRRLLPLKSQLLLLLPAVFRVRMTLR